MVVSLRDPGASELARHLSARLNPLTNWIIRHPPKFISPSCRCPESGLSHDPKCDATIGVTSTAKPRTTRYVIPCGCRAAGSGYHPHPAVCSCGQHVGPAPGFPGRLHGPLLNPPGRTQAQQQRPGRPYWAPQYNQTGLHLNLNPHERSLFQEPTPTDPITMTARNTKTTIPPELRGFMAVVGEIVQEQLRAQRPEEDKIGDDGRNQGAKHEGSDIRESQH